LIKDITILAVFAHPDDEIGTGGVLARYGAQGVRTVLVCTTDGQEATIARPELDLPAVRLRLGKVRAEELRGAAAALGIHDLRMLGYHDSGMAGWPQNDRPEAFMNADFDAVVSRLVGIIREVRPQVLITHNEGGGYGHPDHIMTNRVTVAAFDAAGDPTKFADQSPAPFQPTKLYYNCNPRSRFERMAEVYRQLGRPNPFEQRDRDPNRQRFFTPDEDITTRIYVRDYLDNKRRALRAHKTQIAETNFLLSIPEEMAPDIFGYEHLIRAKGPTNGVAPEDDLLSGLA
jgi:LmbE family N-acetylglucosaminyl deacetylase